MSVIEKVVEWAVKIAKDNSHGYDQNQRWGNDYDCSSLVISAWEQAGVPVKSRGATYTGNMKRVFLNNGFSVVTDGTLKRGDVLLNEVNHTAMYIGAGQIVQASGNENGGIVGGQTGDQTGNEIHIRSYYDFPWDCVLRYSEIESEDQKNEAENGVYVVQSGDSPWSIADRFLGSGSRYPELMEWNGLDKNAVIHPGDILIVQEINDDCEECRISFDESETESETKHVVEYGDNLWNLAEKYLGNGSRYNEIAEASGIDSMDVNNLKVGQVLTIPKK